MIEWMVLGSAIITFVGFKIWAFFEIEKKLERIENRLMDIYVGQNTFQEKTGERIENDLSILKSHDEEIINGVKENLIAFQKLDTVILHVVNNLRPKEEKKKKKEKK
jgi:hypothetical protein